MFRLREIASNYYILKAKMKRARYLYVLFCRNRIAIEGTPALERCARRLMFSGLKKTASIADAEFTVLRILYFIEMGLPYSNGKDKDPFGWHKWLRDNKWKHSTQRGIYWIRN